MATKKTQVNPTLQNEIAAHHVSSSVGSILSILNRAEYGDIMAQAELFDDMQTRDAHIAAEMRKRKLAVSQLEWSLQPNRGALAREKKAVADLELMLRDAIDIDSLVFEMGNAIGTGFSCHEIEWQRNQQGLWTPSKFYFRPQRWFTLDFETRQQIRLRNNKDTYGEELIQDGWITHKHSTQTSGFVAQDGLMRELALPYIFKNFAIKNWLRFSELYAVPIMVLFHNVKDLAAKNELKDSLKNIGRSGVALFEGGTNEDLKTVDAAKGEGQGFQALIDWCEGAISKSILGGTLTTQTGKNGNFATANIHNDVRLQIRDFDAKQIAETLTHQLVETIVRLNGLNLRAKWVFYTTEPEDLSLFADAIPKLVAVGMKISPEYLHEKLKIPMAEEGADILGIAVKPTAAMSALSMDLTPAKFTPDQMVIEELADNVLENLNSPIPEQSIFNAIKAAKNYDDLVDRLAVLFVDTDTIEFRTVLERATFTADCLGFANAS